MKSFKLFKTVTLSVLLLCLAICTVMFATTIKPANATNANIVFEMDEGGYIKLVDDGGMRMRVKMNETTKNEVMGEDNELFFLLMTEEKFDAALTQDGYNFTPYLANSNDFKTNGYIKVVADKSLIYLKDDVYYSNFLIFNFPQAWRTENLCVVAGKTVEGITDFAEFDSKTQVCKQLYAMVNHFAFTEYAPQILEVYSDWFATEQYPILIETQAQYSAVGALLDADLEFEIDLTGKFIEICTGVERDLAYESEVFAGVNLIKNELVVTFMANGEAYKTVQVAKNSLATAPETNPDPSNATATYEFLGWDYDFATAVTDDIVINANFKLISKDITSLFKLIEKSAISVNKGTGAAVGLRLVKAAFSSYVSTKEFVDISEYQGMTLQITMRTSTYYGLVFYSDIHDTTLSGDKETATDLYVVESVYGTEGESGTDHVVMVKIPENAKYVRTTYTANSSLPFSATVVETIENIDITSLFTMYEKSAISVNKGTGAAVGLRIVKGGLSAYISTKEFVDISEYQGMTLQITMRTTQYYGLVFYSDTHDTTLSGEKEAASNVYVVGSAYGTEGESGSDHIVMVKIPENAKYIRTCYSASSSLPFSAIILPE